jgi:hypothetical protein
MTDSNWTIHSDAPTDEDGYPVHPDLDKDHHICARTNSDRTTEPDHGRQRDDYPFCLLSAGHGTKNPKRTGEPGVPCSNHGGDSPKGEDNGNFTHGAFSKYWTSHLTDEEQEAFDDAREMLDSPENAQEVARSAASSCLIQFRRSGDERFLRRFESICDKFGIAPADELEVSGSVELEEAWKSSAQEDDTA